MAESDATQDLTLHDIEALARRAGVPVQAVLLDFSTAYLGKAWPLFQPPVLPLTVRARLGRRFDAPTEHTVFTAELEAYFRREVRVPADPTSP